MTQFESQLFSVLVLAAALLLAWQVFQAVRNGSINSLAGAHQRQTDPWQFWFYVCLRVSLAIAALVFGILGALSIMWRLGRPPVS
jgi:hypothetical protein